MGFKESMKILSRGTAELGVLNKSTFLRDFNTGADLAQNVCERLKRFGRFTMGEYHGVGVLFGVEKYLRVERKVSFTECGESLHRLRIVLFESPKIECEFLTAQVHGGCYALSLCHLMRVGLCNEKVEERSPKKGRKSLLWLRGMAVIQEKLGGTARVSGASRGEVLLFV
jgi:hypothetical protein